MKTFGKKKLAIAFGIGVLGGWGIVQVILGNLFGLPAVIILAIWVILQVYSAKLIEHDYDRYRRSWLRYL